jgi:hypothetical protein
MTYIFAGDNMGEKTIGRGLVHLLCTAWAPGNIDNVEFLQAVQVCIFAGVFYVSWQRNVECVGGVVPIKCYSAIQIARPIFGKVVCLFYASYEMVFVFFSNILTPKIVHH